MMIKNFFRKNKCLKPCPGMRNPCDYCWLGVCKKCLVFQLADFAVTLRSDKTARENFDRLYKRTHGPKVIRGGKGK